MSMLEKMKLEMTLLMISKTNVCLFVDAKKPHQYAQSTHELNDDFFRLEREKKMKTIQIIFQRPHTNSVDSYWFYK